MGKRSEGPYHRLIIRASPRTDIWLADDDGHLVQKERGTLDTSLLPGHYVVEFGLGTQTYPIHLAKDSEYSQQNSKLDHLARAPRSNSARSSMAPNSAMYSDAYSAPLRAPSGARNRGR